MADEIKDAPTEVTPTETSPAETKPAEITPTEAKPAEVKPADPTPAETKPAEAKPQEDKPEQAPNADTQALKATLLAQSAELAAMRAGASPERAGYVAKLANLTGIDPATPEGAASLKAAVEKVLADVPELRGGGGTGSAGNFARKGAQDEKTAMEAQMRAGLGLKG